MARSGGGACRGPVDSRASVAAIRLTSSLSWRKPLGILVRRDVATAGPAAPRVASAIASAAARSASSASTISSTSLVRAAAPRPDRSARSAPRRRRHSGRRATSRLTRVEQPSIDLAAIRVELDPDGGGRRPAARSARRASSIGNRVANAKAGCFDGAQRARERRVAAARRSEPAADRNKLRSSGSVEIASIGSYPMMRSGTEHDRDNAHSGEKSDDFGSRTERLLTPSTMRRISGASPSGVTRVTECLSECRGRRARALARRAVRSARRGAEARVATRHCGRRLRRRRWSFIARLEARSGRRSGACGCGAIEPTARGIRSGMDRIFAVDRRAEPSCSDALRQIAAAGERLEKRLAAPAASSPAVATKARLRKARLP